DLPRVPLTCTRSGTAPSARRCARASPNPAASSPAAMTANNPMPVLKLPTRPRFLRSPFDIARPHAFEQLLDAGGCRTPNASARRHPASIRYRVRCITGSPLRAVPPGQSITGRPLRAVPCTQRSKKRPVGPSPTLGLTSSGSVLAACVEASLNGPLACGVLYSVLLLCCRLQARRLGVDEVPHAVGWRRGDVTFAVPLRLAVLVLFYHLRVSAASLVGGHFGFLCANVPVWISFQSKLDI